MEVALLILGVLLLFEARSTRAARDKARNDAEFQNKIHNWEWSEDLRTQEFSWDWQFRLALAVGAVCVFLSIAFTILGEGVQ